MGVRRCQVCRQSPSTTVGEAEIYLDPDYQLIVKVYVCDACIKEIREHCRQADISTDRNEGFEEFFFDTSMVRLWFQGNPLV